MENLTTFVIEKRTEIKNKIKEQIFTNELRHHYNLRKPRGIKPTTVFFVACINKKQVKISTGLKVYPKHWSENRAKEGCGLAFIESNNNRLLNEKLTLLDMRFEEFKQLVNDGVLSIDKDSLRHYITTGNIMVMKKQKQEPINVARVLQSYLDKDTSIKDGTKANYSRFIKSFDQYLSTMTISSYTDITFEVMRGFQQWCVDNTVGKNGERASGESINKKVECTYKCIRKYLVNNGLMKGSQFADIQIEPLKEVSIDDEIALMDDELTALYNYQCTDRRDEEIRDLFLLECLTGQRFSDVDKVGDFIEHKDGRTYFNLIQDKGGAKVQVNVIFEMALDILKKYSYQLPTHNKKVFNKRIKDIAYEAGIRGQELIRYHEANIAGVSTATKERHLCISSHTGRRTFTTLLSLRGYNETEIARYTGHASLTMVRRYDKSKEGTKVKEMFDRLKAEHPESVLKIVGEQSANNSSANTTNVDFDKIIEVVRENEQSKRKIERLENDLGKTVRESEDKVRRLKHSAEVEKQIESIKGKSDKDEVELLKKLMEIGLTYDDYITMQNHLSEIDDEVAKADEQHDTLIDD